MEKKYAVITGASSGIGTEFARRLSKDGYSLILVARREERLQKLKEELQTECVILTADLTDLEACQRLTKQLDSYTIDVFVNNAGFGYCGEILGIDTEIELSMIDLNVKAVHFLTKYMLDKMEKHDRGYILNVASSAGLLPAGPYMSTYYATKAYVTSFTRGIAEELRRMNSKVYIGCLCPGPVNTEFNQVANVEFALKGISPNYCANYAVDKMWKKKITIVPTFQLKALTVLSRLIPTKLYLKIAAKQQRKKIYN